ncbi:MAG: diacylglycerol kinase family protein [Lachnospiraceae bacterium]|nr:diacylglycerol kinase family protein [Lachnospiraceae bacterium]
MSRYVILYNPMSGNGKGKNVAENITLPEGTTAEFVDITKITDYKSFFDGIKEPDRLVLCGGDGTLNRFVNDTADLKRPKEILFCPSGTGNDFLNDIGKPENGLVELDPYIAHLPTVTVKGKTCYFLNGIGFGIDGYCCEEGDKQRAAGKTDINYTSIAITGLLFHFKPRMATVTVDGVTKTFRKVWIAPTMNGRCYGGGMFPTPGQDRLHNDTVSLMLMYGKGRLKTLMVFPSIFKGEHVKHTEMVEIMSGKEITVKFDMPTALQIDGETVTNVTEYTVKSAALV